MALQPLSIGDILMLSQQAWKIGRAFTQGRNSAPAEFAEVESESNGLADALKITAESLRADGSILERAEPETRAAVDAILESAARTLGDLESFIDRYQVIRKKEIKGGFVVEKSWSDIIIENYKVVKWTTEGGTLSDLRNILQMHTNTINLTMQALQSRSLARLERAVIPLAENISSIHDRVNGDLGEKIDDLHRIIMSIANSTPSLVARDRAVGEGPYSVSPIEGGTILAIEQSPEQGTSGLPERWSHSSSAYAPVRQNRTSDTTAPHDSVHSTPALPLRSPKRGGNRRTSTIDWDFENGTPPMTRKSIGNGYDDVDQTDGASSFLSTSPGTYYQDLIRRESTTLPTFFRTISEEDSDKELQPEPLRRRKSGTAHFSKISEKSEESWRSSGGQPVLPPPALPPSPDHLQSPATPLSLFSGSRRPLSNGSSVYSRPSRPQTAKSVKSVKSEPPVSAPLATLVAFERALMRNSAILCDVRATLVEYAKRKEDELDPRYDTEMVEVCKEARICVVRKRENREHGGTRLATSIWTLSEDGVVRCQHKLSEAAETVPFSSYFQPEKVSISEQEMRLRFHALKWEDPHKEDVKTNWVNYVFGTEADAAAFQSAVFGRMLLSTFKTTKTIVIHQGIKGAFAFEEQFANIETLRFWEDDGIATPGAQGGVMALMHISSNFGEGWARWWMNSTKQQVRVKGENYRYARLKGIDITVVKPGAGISTADKIRHPAAATAALQRVNTMETVVAPQLPAKKIPVKRVTGIKIEFATDEERLSFLEMVERVQRNMLPLPDL